MTLPELLKEAEVEVVGATPASKRTAHGPFKTPFPTSSRTPASGLVREIRAAGVEDRVWTRDDWKQLDACFTDERLEAGRRLGLGVGEDALAGVDLVRVEDVVARFVALMGGTDVVDSFGATWGRFVVLIPRVSNGTNHRTIGMICCVAQRHCRRSNVPETLPLLPRHIPLMYLVLTEGGLRWTCPILLLLDVAPLPNEHSDSSCPPLLPTRRSRIFPRRNQRSFLHRFSHLGTLIYWKKQLQSVNRARRCMLRPRQTQVLHYLKRHQRPQLRSHPQQNSHIPPSDRSRALSTHLQWVFLQRA